VVPERIADIVAGIDAGCALAGCALIGGETAEHPGLLGPDEYDVAGAATGVVEHDRILGPARVRAGDVVVAMASSGLHSNGYSLVRRVVADAGWALDRDVPELGRTLGEELLTPTRVYAADVLDLVGSGLEVHALSHVTGGGLAANLARVLPPGLRVDVERGTWSPAPIFGLVGGLGRVPQGDLERTLNMGVGMLAVVPPESVDATVARLQSRDLTAWPCGEVRADDGTPQADESRGAKGVDGGAVALVGTYR
jgi:phosphoribosylformylglycinamidine cyclo-ligase